jgi:hypothetical protein
VEIGGVPSQIQDGQSWEKLPRYSTGIAAYCEDTNASTNTSTARVPSVYRKLRPDLVT